MNWYVLLDRTLWLCLGVVIGVILGYTLRAREEAHEALEKVEEMTGSPKSKRKDPFARRSALISQMALIVVVIITVWAAFSSQVASSDVREGQRLNDAENSCTSDVLFDMVSAVNERTSRSSEQSGANRELQRAEAELIRAILDSRTELPEEGLENYLQAYNTYESLLQQTMDAQAENPYPTEEQYTSCLREARED